jgi:cell division protein FtsZ
MAKVNPEIEAFARIKVVGVGGSGKNAINHMINSKVKGVEFIAINTDVQDLHHSLASRKIHIGKNVTRGQGAGMNPELGKQAAEETKEEIAEAIKGADMVFIACGMGGGTGTGAAPVVARIAKDQGILTVAVVTKPFFFEGSTRMKIADGGLSELESSVDALIVIPNDKILSIVDKNTPAGDGFAMCDEILRQAVEGISELITTTGKINVDFSDIRAVMQDAGTALMGVGRATGENRAKDAANMAINSPLLDVSIHNAKGVLYVVAGGPDLTMPEIADASRVITEHIDKDAKVIFGYNTIEGIKKGELQVTVIATGFPNQNISPKKNLFSEAPKPISDDRQESLIVDRVERRQINNSLPDEPLILRKSDKAVRTEEAKKEEVLNLVTDDDDEDDNWNAVPAFLRRKK